MTASAAIRTAPARNGELYPGGGSTFFITGNPGDSFAVKTTWDASAHGRLGYLIVPSFLVYTTGGAAWLHVETTASCGPVSIAGDICNPIGAAPGTGRPFTIQNSHTMVGWTVGGGVEALLWGNWIARAEYRYSDYGHVSNTDTFGGGGSFLRIVSTTERHYAHLKLRSRLQVLIFQSRTRTY